MEFHEYLILGVFEAADFTSAMVASEIILLKFKMAGLVG
jgi:hypothetical protein